MHKLADTKAPWWLNARQKRIWKRTLENAPKGVLKRIDWEVFAEYCVMVDTFTLAQRKQNKLDLLDGAGQPSSYLRIVRQTVELLTKLRAELGFSPVARVRLGTPAVKVEEADEWGNLQRVPLRGEKTKAA